MWCRIRLVSVTTAVIQRAKQENTMENERILGVTTVGGKLCFTFVFQPKTMTQAQVEEIMTQVMAFLFEATATP